MQYRILHVISSQRGVVLEVEPVVSEPGISFGVGEVIDVKFCQNAPAETVEPTGNSQ